MEASSKPEKINTPLAALPPTDRAYLVLSEKHNEQALVELAGKYIDVTEIKDVTDYRLVMRGGIELMKARTAIEKTGRAARKDARDYCDAILMEEKRLIGITSREENRLRGMRKDYDDEQERIAEEARLIEQRRIADITERIQAIKRQVDGLLGSDSTAIQMRLDAVNTIVCNESLFAEFAEQAAEVKAGTIETLTTLLEAREEFESQMAENRRIALEQAERQAEIDKRAEEQRKTQEAEQARLDAKAAELQRKQDEIDAKLKAEEDRKLAEERAEAEKIRQEKERLEQEEADRIRQEEADRLQAEEDARQEALRPEKDRLIDWLKKLRFIDGVELHDKNLAALQALALKDLATLSETMIKAVESA